MVAARTPFKLFFALVFTAFFFSSVSFAQECMDGHINFGTGDADDACHNVEGWNSTNGEDKWMNINANQYVELWTDHPGEAHTLSFVHYDGLCDDSFNLYVNEHNLFSYDHGTESGSIAEEVNIPAYVIDSNTVILRFRNLATDSCGHAGINWIELDVAGGGGSLKQNGESCDYSTECESENCLHGICCESGQVCCETSADCPSGEECGDYYYCEAQPCCGTKNLCEFCTIDSDCISGLCKTFDDGQKRCTTSAHPDVGCCPDAHHMEHPVVGTDCCTTAGCDAGYTCVNYKCVSGGGGTKGLCESCESSTECMQGSCSSMLSGGSKCVPQGFVSTVDCCSNSDCNAGKTCVNKKCTIGGGGTGNNCTSESCNKVINCLNAIGGCMISIGQMIPCLNQYVVSGALVSDSCELASRMENGDPVGVVITGIFTALDIEDAAEAIVPCNIAPPVVIKDVVVGTLSCTEGIIYEALENCGGYTGCATKIINRLKEMKESAVAVFVGSPVDVKINGMYLEGSEIINRLTGSYMIKTPQGETFVMLTQNTVSGEVNIEIKGNTDIPIGEYGNYSITKIVIDKGKEVSSSTTPGTILQGETKAFSMTIPTGFGRKVGETGSDSMMWIALLAIAGGIAIGVFMMKGRGPIVPSSPPGGPTPPRMQSVKPAQPAKPARGVCKSCGKSNKLGSSFCTGCGKRL